MAQIDVAKIDKDFKEYKARTDQAFINIDTAPRTCHPMINEAPFASNGQNSYLVGEHRKRVI